jgi:hypothetical protein
MRGLGERGLILAPGRSLVTQALWRLLFICVVAGAGETIAYQFGAYDQITLASLVGGVAAYVLTQDLGRPRPGGGRRGEIKYWRGRKIDDDDGPRRLN